VNRKVPLWLVLLLVWIFGFTTILFGWAVWYIGQDGSLIGGKAKDVIISIAQFPSLAYVSIKQLTSPSALIVPDRYPDIDGLKLTDKNYVDSNYVLLSSYDKDAKQSVVKLLRLSDQKILHQWTPDIDEIVKYKDEGRKLSERTNKKIVDLNHPLLSADGSIIFNTEDGPLMKLSRDSKFLWHIKGTFHHSLVIIY